MIIVTASAADKLEQDLVAAQETFAKSHSSLGSVQALRAVCEYLSALDLPTAPLEAAMGAIMDKDGSGKPVNDSIKLAFAARSVDLLVAAGVKPRSAAASAVVRAAHLGVSTTQLLEYRKNLGKGRARPEAIHAYQQALQTWKSALAMVPVDLPAAQRQKIILDAVGRWAIVGKK